MRNNLNKSIKDVPRGEMATRALTKSIEAGLIPLHVKYLYGLGAYTNLMRVMQTLDEEIGLAIRQDHLWKSISARAMRPITLTKMFSTLSGGIVRNLFLLVITCFCVDAETSDFNS